MHFLLIEPQSDSFAHEIINLEILNILIKNQDAETITVIGRKSFISNLRTLISTFIQKDGLSHLFFHTMVECSNPFSLKQIFIEYKLLKEYGSVDRIQFLSVSPATLIAIFLWRLTSHSKKKIDLIWHGNLANLLPNRIRPDKFFVREGIMFRINVLRLLMMSKRLLYFIGFCDPNNSSKVLSPHIVTQFQNLKFYTLLKLEYAGCPVFQFNVADYDYGQCQFGPIRIIVLGRFSHTALEYISSQLQLSTNRIEFLVDTNLINKFGFRENISFVPLNSRSQILQEIENCHFIFLLRTSNESLLRLSGVMLESIACNRPIIYPHWYLDLDIGFDQTQIGFSYGDTQQLISLLSDEAFLHSQLVKFQRPF